MFLRDRRLPQDISWIRTDRTLTEIEAGRGPVTIDRCWMATFFPWPEESLFTNTDGGERNPAVLNMSLPKFYQSEDGKSRRMFYSIPPQ